MKKFMAIAAAAALVLSLTACKNDTVSDSESSAPDSSAADSNTPDSADSGTSSDNPESGNRKASRRKRSRRYPTHWAGSLPPP